MIANSVHYTYLDLMRHMRPYNLKEDIHFAVFGSFDAIHVEQIAEDNQGDLSGPFEQMKRMHEERHGRVSWQSERQPMFLASVGNAYKVLDVDEFPDDLDEKNRTEYLSYPLLLSVLQVEKKMLRGSTFEGLIDKTNAQLQSYLNGTGAYGACFFNLGQSDLVLAIRCPVLDSAAHAIMSFWNEGIKVTDELTLRLKSSSSHCAFRLRGKTELRGALKKWLKREAQQEKKISFRADYVFTDEYNQITQENGKRILFGDFDLTDELFDLSDYKKTANIIAEIFIYHNLHSKTSEEKYIASSTVPIIELNQGFFRGVQLQHHALGKWYDEYNALARAFDELKIMTRKLGDNWNDREHLISQIGSISMTLQGLYKYLHRLGVACFEYDLEAYTSPIFGKMTRIVRQMLEIMKAAKKKKDVDAAHVYIVEFTMHTVKLITELQHLYSVLSISPNTFMETYGSSMRSLNAASTLLTAYQGILYYLNKKLPTKYYVAGERDELRPMDAEHTTLLIPYRMTTSSNIILYPGFSPKQRLALFHVDFTRMFNLKYTLFMLGHESGHMLGDQLREERFGIFVRVALRQYVERNIFGWYFSNPVDAFLTLGNQNTAGSKKEIEENHKNLQIMIGLENTDWHRFYGELQETLDNAVKLQIQKQTNRSAESFEEDFEEIRKQTESSEQIKGWYLDDVVLHLKDYIKKIYCASDSTARRLEIAANLSDVYKQTAMIAESVLKGKSYNRRYFSRLKAYYTADYRKYIIYRRMVSSPTDQKIVMLDWIANTFRDIHADVFACKLLGVTKKDYARMLRDFAGCEIDDVIITPGNLIRYDALYISVFNEVLSQSAFEEDFMLTHGMAIQCSMRLQAHRRSSAHELYLDFAQRCCMKIESQLDRLQNEPQFKAIRTMYNMNLYSPETMNAILCMYSEVFNEEA